MDSSSCRISVFWRLRMVFSHPFPSQMHRFVLRIFYLTNFYIGASSQQFFNLELCTCPVRSPLNLGQQSPRDLSDPFRWTWRLDESFVLSLFGLVALFPTYFWLGAMLILDVFFLISPFSFQDLVFSLNISKNRRAPSVANHDKLNYQPDLHRLRVPSTNPVKPPKNTVPEITKESCVGPEDS